MMKESSLLKSKFSILVVLVRVGLLLSCFQWNQQWATTIQSNPALSSLLVRATSTMEYWHELRAQHAVMGIFPEEYKNRPMLYQFLLPLIEQLEYSGTFASIGIGIFLILVDFLVAWLIEQLGVYLLHHEHKDREDLVQLIMPESIQPKRATVFQLSWDQNATLPTDDEKPTSMSRSQFPTLGAMLYLYSPLTILCGVQLSFQSLVFLGTLWTCYECSRPRVNSSWAAFVLAMVAYIEPFLLVMVIPCFQLTKHSKSFLVFTAVYFTALHLLSFLLVGAFMVNINFPIYSHPNLGPLWYFTMQVFPRFQLFFQVMFAGLPYLLVLPLMIRLYRYPLVLVTCYWCVFTIFHYHPTTQDFTIALALMALSPRSLARTSKPSLISICALPVPLLLYLLDCWMWLETGLGNANFIFFQCLAYQVFVTNIFVDFCGASVKRDKAIRITEKMEKLLSYPNGVQATK